MDIASTLWIILFFMSAFLFFAAAAVITVIGSSDLKDLLRKSDRHNA